MGLYFLRNYAKKIIYPRGNIKFSWQETRLLFCKVTKIYVIQRVLMLLFLRLALDGIES